MALEGKTRVLFLIIFAAVLTDAFNTMKRSSIEEANNSTRLERRNLTHPVNSRSRIGSKHHVVNPVRQNNVHNRVTRAKRWTQTIRIHFRPTISNQPKLLTRYSYHGPYRYPQFSNSICFKRNFYYAGIFRSSHLFCTCQCPQKSPDTTTITPSIAGPDTGNSLDEDKTPQVNPEDYYNTTTGISLEPVKPLRPITMDVPSPHHSYDADEIQSSQKTHLPKG